jgi:hypothetical protein
MLTARRARGRPPSSRARDTRGRPPSSDARRTRGRPPSSRSRRRLAVALALGCCAPILAGIPAAAAPDHTGAATGAAQTQSRSGTPHNQPERPAAGESPAGGPAGSQGTAPAAPPAGAPRQDPGRHEPPGAQSGQDSQNAASRERHGAAGQGQTDAGHHERAGVGAQTQQNTASHEQSSAGSQARQDPTAQTQRETASRERHTGGQSQHGAGKQTGRSQRGGGNREQPDTGSSPQAAPPSSTAATPSTATPAAGAASLARTPAAPASAMTSAATPTAQTPTSQGKGAPQPATSARSHHAARRTSARGRTAGRARRTAASPPHVLALAAARASARASRTAHARAAAHRRPRRGRPSVLVTTITKIVGVVPTPVWILVAVLLALSLALAVRTRLAALRARRLERQRGELLEDVGLLQAALLPVPPARLGPVDTSAAYRPADGPGAGGDFYDVFALADGRLAVIVGDVSGHGRQALPHTALVRFTLRAYLEAGLSPRVAVQTAGTVLERQLGESFATAVAATYDPRARLLVYACAGHPPPLVTGSQSLVPITLCSSPPIGAGMPTGARQTTVSLPGRTQVCFYTDGITEARTASQLFGIEGLARVLAEVGPHAGASALLDRVAAATDARPDDMAACLLRVAGAGTPPAVLLEELELDRDDLASERTKRFLDACGVAPREVAALLRSTPRAVGSARTVILELHHADGAPQVTLRHDNVAHLRTPHARPRSAAGASQ